MKIEVVTSIVGYWAAQLFHLTTQNMSTTGDQMKILPVQPISLHEYLPPNFQKQFI